MDVLNEFVSLDEARETYKVVLDAKTLQVNEEKTAHLRAQVKIA